MQQFGKSGKRIELERIPSDERHILDRGKAVVHVCGWNVRNVFSPGIEVEVTGSIWSWQVETVIIVVWRSGSDPIQILQMTDWKQHGVHIKCKPVEYDPFYSEVWAAVLCHGLYKKWQILWNLWPFVRTVDVSGSDRVCWLVGYRVWGRLKNWLYIKTKLKFQSFVNRTNLVHRFS